MDLSPGPDAIVHTSASLSSNSLRLDGTWLKAEGQSGMAVLEYRSRTDNSFLGTVVVDVRQYYPDNIKDVDVGVILGSEVPLPSGQAGRPVVTRGLGNSPPYLYQVTSLGPPTDGQVFAVRPMPEDQQIEVFWMKRDGYNVIWPYEMDRYRALWPVNFEAITRRVYDTHDAVGSTTKSPLVRLPEPPINVRIHYNEVISATSVSMASTPRDQNFSVPFIRRLICFTVDST